MLDHPTPGAIRCALGKMGIFPSHEQWNRVLTLAHEYDEDIIKPHLRLKEMKEDA